MDLCMNTQCMCMTCVYVAFTTPRMWNIPAIHRCDLFINMACIAGSRLGLMQSMAGLAAVLAKFSVEPAPESVRYPKVSGGPGIVQLITAGLPLVFKERKKIL